MSAKSPNAGTLAMYSGHAHSANDSRRRAAVVIPFVAILLLAALLDIVVAMQMSVTRDEGGHTMYGARVLQMRPDRAPAFNSQMPVSALNALPHAIASYLDTHHVLPRISRALHTIRASRIPTILAALVLDVFIFLWAYDLYGAAAALAACLLAALSPSLIAHGTLATTDTYHAECWDRSTSCAVIFS